MCATRSYTLGLLANCAGGSNAQLCLSLSTPPHSTISPSSHISTNPTQLTPPPALPCPHSLCHLIPSSSAIPIFFLHFLLCNSLPLCLSLSAMKISPNPTLNTHASHSPTLPIPSKPFSPPFFSHYLPTTTYPYY